MNVKTRKKQIHLLPFYTFSEFAWIILTCSSKRIDRSGVCQQRVTGARRKHWTEEVKPQCRAVSLNQTERSSEDTAASQGPRFRPEKALLTSLVQLFLKVSGHSSCNKLPQTALFIIIETRFSQFGKAKESKIKPLADSGSGEGSFSVFKMGPHFYIVPKGQT